MVEALANNAKMPKAMLYSRENFARQRTRRRKSKDTEAHYKAYQVR